MKAFSLVGLVIALAGCRNPVWPGDKICTTEFRFGLSVQVKDSVSGAWAASGAQLVLRDGAYADSASYPPNRSDLDALSLNGAGERAGTYEVTVRKAGFMTWQRQAVRVTANECHVNSVSLTAMLTKLPPGGR
jgi:hypothetical protein